MSLFLAAMAQSGCEADADHAFVRLVDCEPSGDCILLTDGRTCGAYARVDDSYDGWARPSTDQVTDRPGMAAARPRLKSFRSLRSWKWNPPLIYLASPRAI